MRRQEYARTVRGVKRLGSTLAVLAMITGAFAVVLFAGEDIDQAVGVSSAGGAYVVGFTVLLLGFALIIAAAAGARGFELMLGHRPAIYRALRPLVSGPIRQGFLGAVGIMLFTTGTGVIREPGRNDRLVWDYCSYGSVSEAQRRGCEERVDPSTIRRLDTSAARFARGELQACLADSGPFCPAAVGARDAGY